MTDQSADRTFKIGTRGSPLALTQAEMLKAAILEASPELIIEIVPIKSAADWKMLDPEKALDTVNGGKGQFAKEIEDRILDGSVDCGVHSLKDMASFLPKGLVIEHYMTRADARDAFICDDHATLDKLPAGANVGTCSPRRAAFVLEQRPDLNIVPFRGNVRTRLDKVKAGQVDATYLAMAGITRLRIDDPIIHAVEVDDMLPACGQGIVCVETRAGDNRAHEVLNPVHDALTGFCAVAEREVLRLLDGSCHTPIGAYAAIENGMLHLRVIVSSNDGQEVYKQELREACTSVTEATDIGVRVGEAIRAVFPEGFLD